MQVGMDLGYKGSENLYRTPEGIKWKPNQQEGAFGGLREYPIKVKFTQAGIDEVRRRCADYGHSTIVVFAITQHGERYEILSINTNFFGYMTHSNQENPKRLSAYVRNYDSPVHPEHRNIEAIIKNDPNFDERDYPKQWKLKSDATIVSFGATYILGYASVDDTLPFAETQTRKKESLLLRIDAVKNQFFLTLEHTSEALRRIGEQNKKVKMEIHPLPAAIPAAVERQKMNVEEKKAVMEKMVPQQPVEKVVAKEILDENVPEGFVCPLTQEIMKDPVMDPEGNSYERSAIEAWLDKNQTSPITRKSLTKENLFPNRALKDAIAAHLKSKK